MMMGVRMERMEDSAEREDSAEDSAEDLAEDSAERELKDQKFYDDIFLKVKAFFGTDLAKMLGDKIAFLSADSIRDFVMARLLPVDGDLVVKFLKFIRCSWNRTIDPGFERLGERILSHAPKAANGLDGLDIGADAETLRNNLQKLKTKAADKMALVASSLQLSVEEFQRAFNA